MPAYELSATARSWAGWRWATFGKTAHHACLQPGHIGRDRSGWLAASGVPLLPVSHEANCFAAHGVPCFEETADLILTSELGGSVAATLGESSALFLVNHGIVCVGPDLETATVAAIILERGCAQQLLATGYGGSPTWSDEVESLSKTSQHLFQWLGTPSVGLPGSAIRFRTRFGRSRASRCERSPMGVCRREGLALVVGGAGGEAVVPHAETAVGEVAGSGGVAVAGGSPAVVVGSPAR